MKKILTFILILCTVALLFTSCAKADSMEKPAVSPDYSYSGDGTDDTASKNEATESRKIIKTYNLSLETKLFNEDCAFIVAEAEKLGGYVSNSSVSGNTITSDQRASRFARYTIRIPSEQTEAYVALLSDRCNVRSSNLTTEDITESYYGIRSQLDSLVIQEQKLNAMLEKASSLSEMITLDDKLTAVRAQINELNYKLQNMDKSVDYSYVYIGLNEVIEYQSEEKTYWQKLGKAVSDSFENFVDVLGALLIALVWIAPFALVGGFVAAIFIFIVIRRTKKKKNNDRNNNQT